MPFNIYMRNKRNYICITDAFEPAETYDFLRNDKRKKIMPTGKMRDVWGCAGKKSLNGALFLMVHKKCNIFEWQIQSE